jgi:hypothetical protein
MASKANNTTSPTTPFEPAKIFNFGKESTEATLNIQKDLLDAYEQASRAWLARVQSEVDLWSQLAAKLTATRSVPEALAAYQESVAQRMQMASEDGRKLSQDCKEILDKITGSIAKGRGAAST